MTGYFKLIQCISSNNFRMIVLYALRNSAICFSMYPEGGSAVATSKMERFVIIVNGWKPLTIITKRSILDVAAALDPHLVS